MSNMTIYEKLNFINNNTNLIKQILVDSGLLTADEATLENLPPTIQEFIRSQQENPYEKLYMQRTANETSMVGLFAYTPASTTLDLSNINTSKVTDMSYMFNYCKVSYLDLSGFDVSNVTNMEYMFSFCSSEINVDGWDTSKLTNVDHMFYYFTNNNKYLDLSVLDFSNVTKVNYLFNNCNVDNIDIRNINIDLTKLDWDAYSGPELFYSCKGTLDLSNWTLDSSMTSLKKLCSWFYGIEVNFTNWKTTNITNMEGMFYYNTYLERLIMPDWDMTNVTNTKDFFYNCNKLHTVRLDNCNNATISKIISLLPTKAISGVTKTIYCKEENAAGLTAPTSWVFEFIEEPDSSYDEVPETLLISDSIVTEVINEQMILDEKKGTYDSDNEKLIL